MHTGWIRPPVNAFPLWFVQGGDVVSSLRGKFLLRASAFGFVSETRSRRPSKRRRTEANRRRSSFARELGAKQARTLTWKVSTAICVGGRVSVGVAREYSSPSGIAPWSASRDGSRNKARTSAPGEPWLGLKLQQCREPPSTRGIPLILMFTVALSCYRHKGSRRKHISVSP